MTDVILEKGRLKEFLLILVSSLFCVAFLLGPDGFRLGKVETARDHNQMF